MIDNDKIGQTPAKFDNVIDNIFKVVFVINYHKGDKFLLAPYDPTQLQPIRGRTVWCPPVLFHVTKLFLSKFLSAHKMIIFRIQQIDRNSYK